MGPGKQHRLTTPSCKNVLILQEVRASAENWAPYVGFPLQAMDGNTICESIMGLVFKSGVSLELLKKVGLVVYSQYGGWTTGQYGVVVYRSVWKLEVSMEGGLGSLLISMGEELLHFTRYK